MFWYISMAITFVSAWFGYATARRFVRDRLRYVEAAQRPGAPMIAAIVAMFVAAPVAWLLPLVSAFTAIVFGVSVGLGVRAGAVDVKRGYLVSSSSR